MKQLIAFLFILGTLPGGYALETVKPPQTLQEAGLIDVEEVPQLHVFLDIRYATENNFIGKPIYSSPKCYLREEAVEGLKKAAELAAQHEQPFTFCLLDCYRPLSAQKELWKAKPNPNYVAPPAKGSRHNRGMAVDLMPCSFIGQPFEMPTGFDDFTPKAHMDYMDLPENMLQNREALKKVMVQAGFTYTRTEWWHFDRAGWKQFPVLDIPFPNEKPTENLKKAFVTESF